ncbi:MAG: transcription-repair coupling factor, partial [Chloroflexi bacterium]|nr:transcription-repair coupling factor [Chloroflexota bacterium]
MELSNLISVAIQGPVTYSAGTMESGGHAYLQAPLSARPFIIAALHKYMKKKSIVFTVSAERAQTMAHDLELWLGRIGRVFVLPAPDEVLYSRVVSADKYEIDGILAAFTQSSNAILVAPASWLLRKVSLESSGSNFIINTFDNLSMEKLASNLHDMGYKLSDTVNSKGQWARRGGIIDIFSLQDDNPVRVEFFGNSVDSMRYFDISTQRSMAVTEQAIIMPATTVSSCDVSFLLEKLQSLNITSLNKEAQELWQNDIALLQSGIMPHTLSFYASFLPQQNLSEYADYIYIDEHNLLCQSLDFLYNEAQILRRSLIQNGDISQDFPFSHFELTQIKKKLEQQKGLSLLNFGDNTAPHSAFHVLTEYFIGSSDSRFKMFANEIIDSLKSGNSILCLSTHAERLTELLEAEGIAVLPFSRIMTLKSGTLAMYNASLSGGFKIGNLIVITDKELYGIVKERHLPVKRINLGKLSSYRELKEGAYVVHVDHGIGKYLGVKEMTIGSEAKREYLILEYAGQERLYVPVDQLARVAAYIGGGAEPKVSRLSGTMWEDAKKEAKEAAEDVAEDLLHLYAQREISKGFAFAADVAWQGEMENAFLYNETVDQLAAIAAIKQDMESPKPMDRLILGDVGYGKTEVAIRAAFKAVMDSKQVAVLVPTTVLAAQHYNTFKERLSSFPVRIEVISRFRSDREQQDILVKVAAGQIDIIIGTHRLLQKDVRLPNLGLLIIDEEQRFGVRHKEYLKKMRTEVDVLSLSATPIPRTLQMSLSGVRDLSVIETPPSERLSVKTYVAAESEHIIREAIMREIERQGQVFFVHNCVQSIDYTAEKIRRIVPEARIAVGHGQMKDGHLEEVMRSFMAGEIDVLVSTTIIENGVDIPSANTLIVSRADTFGLTQLYQLRGRVGRSSVSSYAYLLYERDILLSSVAAERLQTLYDASSLGAGYSIAMKDLEIRGAGNLLGI